MDLMKIKRKAAKFNFELTLHQMADLPKSGNVLYLIWRRGRKWTGETKKAFVKDKVAVWEENGTFKVSLFKNSQDRYKRKYLEIDVHEVNKDLSKGRIGQLKVNLADFASTEEDKNVYNKVETVKLWNKQDAQLKYTITCTLRRRNNGTLESEMSEATTMTEVSSDEDDATPQTPVSVDSSLSPNDPFEDKTSFKRLSGRRNVLLPNRRRAQMSMGGDQDSSFMDLIQNVDKAVEEQVRSPTENKRASRGKIKSPQMELAEKEKEMIQLQEKLLKMEQDSMERHFIDTLIHSIQPQYDGNYPISAPILYRILQHLDAFKPEKEEILTKVVTAINSVVSKSTSNLKLLCYWFSNVVLLLNIIQKDFPATIDVSTPNSTDPIHITIPDDPLGNDPKSPPPTHTDHITSQETFAFGNSLSKFCADLSRECTVIYAALISNAYDRLVIVLIPSMFSTLGKMGRMSVSHITKILLEYDQAFQESKTPSIICAKFFNQLYYYINGHTLNAIFKDDSKHCNMGTSIQLKMSISELEEWATKRGYITQELSQLRQISDAMMMNKVVLADEATRKEICPSLSAKQVRRMLVCFKPDEYDPEAVPQSVLKQFSQPSGDSREYLSDTSVLFRVGFHVDRETPMWRSVKPPDSLLEHKDFVFLKE
ncbi:hypothetical protein AKO1_015835 [Acrasis kona]|uniref:C2 NT-type domain-containing protein n=1 Tax=Acrasis kona TaxID=1008807 RepID=A0AAW2ZHD1_9EUKA